MTHVFFFWIFLFLFNVSSVWSHEMEEDPEEQLYDYLFTNTSYKKAIRPGIVRNRTKQATDVYVIFVPYRIIELDGHLETMSAMVLITEVWHDPRLAWDPSQFGGINTITTQEDSVWTPNSYILNLQTMNPDDKSSKFTVRLTMEDKNPLAAQVYLVTYALMQERCQFNMTYYPFDQQTCLLTLSQTQHQKTEVKYTVLPYNYTGFMDGGEWELKNTSVMTSETTYGNVSLAFLSITVQRRCLYYVINLFLPTIFICILNTIGLFASVTADQDELDFASMGQTTLLSLGIMLVTVADQTPKGSDQVSLMGVFFLAMIVQTLMAAVTAMYLRKWHKRRMAEQATVYPRLPYRYDTGSEKMRVRGCLFFHLFLIALITAVILGVGFASRRGNMLFKSSSI